MSNQITAAELVNILDAKRGAFFVTITARTEEKKLLKRTVKAMADSELKARLMSGPLMKTSRVNGLLNWSYENAVNNQRCREAVDGEPAPHFDSHARAWGVRVIRENGTLTPFVSHNGALYVELKIQKSLDHEYDVAGEPINTVVIHGLLEPAKSDSGRQEVERPVILRDYTLTNITAITIDGVEYTIRAE